MRGPTERIRRTRCRADGNPDTGGGDTTVERLLKQGKQDGLMIR